MKNRKLLLIVSLVLAMTMSLGGTLAYLTDTDADVNTMVLGNVKIEQIEKERIEQSDDNLADTNLQDYTQNKPLIPAVGQPEAWAKNEAGEQVYQSWPTGGSSALFTDDLKNVQDKFVFVENTGNTDAYVRTIFALEAGSLSFAEWDEMMHWNMNDTHWAWSELGEEAVVTIDGNKYYYWIATYKGTDAVHTNGILPDGETTRPSLLQVFLDSKADNDTTFNLDGNSNGTYDILVLSQAIQKDGFETAAAAFKAGFDNNADAPSNDLIVSWFQGDDFADSGLPVIETVKTLKELQDALNDVPSDTTIVLGADIVGNVTYTQESEFTVLVDGDNHSFTGVFSVNGGSAGYETAELIIKDVNFVAAEGKDSCILFGASGTTQNRYVRNVTVSNCTFSDNDGTVDCAAVRSLTGGDKYVTIENCTVNKGMHSLCQLQNVEEGLEITNCKVYSKNGANLNQTFTALIDDCTFDVQGYAVRVGAKAGNMAAFAENFTIKDSTLKSACEADDDAVIVFRLTAQNATMNLENVTLAGDVQFLGNTSDTIINN